MSPRRIVLASALALVALTGCGAVTPTDFVASVDDVELTESEFDELAREVVGDSDATEVDGITARQIVGTFVGLEVVRADLAALDVDMPEVEAGELTGISALQNEFQLFVQAWSTLPAATTVDDRVVAFYEQGPQGSGITCAAHILVETEDDAVAVLDELDAGAPFEEVAAASSIDTGTADRGGALGCQSTDEFAGQMVPEFAEAALAAEIGVPTEPVESQFGWHVIVLAPIDEIDDQSVVQLRLGTVADRYDIKIDPRFGAWDPNQIIVPVG